MSFAATGSNTDTKEPAVVIRRPLLQEFDIICRSSSSSSLPPHQSAHRARYPSNAKKNSKDSNPGNIHLRTVAAKHSKEYTAATNKTEQRRAARKVMVDLLASSSSTRFLTKDPVSLDTFRLATARAARETIWHCLSTMKARKTRMKRRHMKSNKKKKERMSLSDNTTTGTGTTAIYYAADDLLNGGSPPPTAVLLRSAPASSVAPVPFVTSSHAYSLTSNSSNAAPCPCLSAQACTSTSQEEMLRPYPGDSHFFASIPPSLAILQQQQQQPKQQQQMESSTKKEMLPVLHHSPYKNDTSDNTTAPKQAYYSSAGQHQMQQQHDVNGNIVLPLPAYHSVHQQYHQVRMPQPLPNEEQQQPAYYKNWTPDESTCLQDDSN